MSYRFFYKMIATVSNKRTLEAGALSAVDCPHKKSSVSVLRKLPLGHDDFETIITTQGLYIDKTKHIYELVENPGNAFYFLSRMRRSGKSLALSTLKALFEGKRHLFEGLYISKTDYDFKPYPIIYLNMSKIAGRTETDLDNNIKVLLTEIAEKHDISVYQSDTEWIRSGSLNLSWPCSQVFDQLIQKIKNKHHEKVVILIDEYDAPIITYMHTPEIMNRNNDFLKDFYKVLKHSTPDIRFSAVFGISNFAKSNMYSGLNNLDDLSKNLRFADFCGITVPELKHFFGDRLDALSLKWGQPVDELVKHICYWYDGYSYLPGAEKVLNPFSTMSFFKNETFDQYWFHTGTTDFLVSTLANMPHPPKPESIDKVSVSKASLFDINLADTKNDLIPIMFQAGYLTFIEAPTHRQQQVFNVGFPNNEVRLAFYGLLLRQYSKLPDSDTSTIATRIQTHIREANSDALISDFKVFFSQVPYNVCPVSAVLDREAYYQSLLFVFLKTLGYSVAVEVTPNTGRIDCVFETPTHIFLMEFKLNRSAQEALDQIKDKAYMSLFEHRDKEIHMIGINFSSDNEIRNITDYHCEMYHTVVHRELCFGDAKTAITEGKTQEAITILQRIYQPQASDALQAAVAAEIGKCYETGHAGFELALPFYHAANTLLAQLPQQDTPDARALRANAKRGEGYCLLKPNQGRLQMRSVFPFSQRQ